MNTNRLLRRPFNAPMFFIIALSAFLLQSKLEAQSALANLVASGQNANGESCSETHFQLLLGLTYETNYDTTNDIEVTVCASATVNAGAYACPSGTGAPTYTVTYDKTGQFEVAGGIDAYGKGSFEISVLPSDKGGSITFHADAVGGPLHAHKDCSISVQPGNSGCSACGGGGGGGGHGLGPTSGSPKASNDSVNFGMALGLGSQGANEGYLQIYTDLPSTNLAQPSCLSLTFKRPDVQVITNLAGFITQVKAPQCLVTVSNIDNYDYALLFIDDTNVTGFASGQYTYSGTPLVTWLVQNPDGSTASNRVWFTEIRSGVTMRVFKYSCNTLGGWDLLESDGLTLVQTSQTGGGGITNKMRNTYYNSQLVSSEAFTYQTIQNLNYSLLLSATKGIGTLAQTTVYTYYSANPTNGASTNLLKRIDYPDGRWEYYVYDDNGYLATKYESFLNNPAPAPNSVPDPATIGCRMTTYSPAGPGNINQGQPTETIVKIPTASGGAWSLNTVSDETRHSSYNNADSYGNNLLVVLTSQNNLANPVMSEVQSYVLDLTYYSGDLSTVVNMYRYGKTRSRSYPDGTVTVYDYCPNSDGTLIISNRTGVVGGSGNWFYPGDMCNIVDGTETVELQDSLGRTINKISRDIVSGLVVSKVDYKLLSPYISGRDYQVVNLAGQTNSYFYDCCSLESSVDPEGVETGYTYDMLTRLTATTVFRGGGPGITTTRVLDGAGNLAGTQRTGTDGSTIVLSQNMFDSLGRTIIQTNALGGITTIEYSITNVSQSVTNWYPDGGTRIETYYLDGQLQSVKGTGVHGKAYVYGYDTDLNGNACTYTTETNLDSSWNLTSEWTKTYRDAVGRTTEILYSDGATEKYDYNNQGLLAEEMDPDGVSTLYQYDAKGQLAFTAIDIDQNGMIDFNGADRITWRTNDVVNDHGMVVHRTRSLVWASFGIDTSNLVSETESSANGLNSWQIEYRDSANTVTNYTAASYAGNLRTNVTVAVDGSYTTQIYSYARLLLKTKFDSTGSQIGRVTYSYDAHGHQNMIVDARNGTTTLGFNNADLVATNTTPNPGSGSAETTISFFDNSMRLSSTIQPDGATVNSVYLPTGELGLQYGSRTFPVGYSYDYAGRVHTMTNWSNYGGGSPGARVTTWNYDSHRGWLTNKRFFDNTGPLYTYTTAGRLASRTWSRGTATVYKYDNAGGLTNVAYSDATPSFTNNYDRMGRMSSVICNGLTDTMTYNLAGEMVSDTFTGGVLDGLSVTNVYDQYLRRTNLATYASATLSQTTYGYDTASRLTSVTDGNSNSASYVYLANSFLVGQITFKQNSTTRMTTTKQYDFLNRLTAISSVPSASYVLPLTFNYNYNLANQRTSNTLADGSYWVYGYDSLGQVTNGCKYFIDGTPVAGQQFDYTFDTIGNRTQARSGGDFNGTNLRVVNYTNNTLNQVTGRDVSPYIDVIGASILTNTVIVNGQTAYRKEEYFRQQIPAYNINSALWTNVIVTGGLNVTGNVYVAKQPEVFSYDADGNLTNDGRWAYAWDAENRLIGMTVNTNIGPQYKLLFAYDSKSRRTQKIVTTNNGASYVGQYTNIFIYDGWNVVAELTPGKSPIRTYTWGQDLSGALQGAGGIGGLLEVSYYGSFKTNCFLTYDGNGNVIALINTTDATIAANYDYGPFGEVIRQTGPMAEVNPFRFSTKYQDDESDLLYYGYRYYKASTGTWLSRDPLGESAFLANHPRMVERFADREVDDVIGVTDVYDFVGNDSLDSYDVLGLANGTHPKPPPPPPPSPGCGTWKFNIEHNGDPNIQTDVTYKMCKSENCNCSKAVIDRYVKKKLGIWPGSTGDYYPDSDGGGGFWDPVDGLAHAEGDGPDGPLAMWPSSWHLPWTFSFKWNVRCTEGKDSGKILATTSKNYLTTGHKTGDGYTGLFQ